MADIKISEMTSASQINETDNIELSQASGNGYATVKGSISDIASKIASGINFNTLDTTAKTIIGAINEAAQGGGGGGLPNYSTTEHKIGRKWIDGKDIYEITVDGLSLSLTSGADSWVNTGISSIGMDSIIDVFALDGYKQFYPMQAVFMTAYNTIGIYQKVFTDRTLTTITIQYTKAS